MARTSKALAPTGPPPLTAAQLLHALSDAQREALTLRAFVAAFGPRAGFYATNGDLLLLDVEGAITIWRSDAPDRITRNARLWNEHRKGPYFESLMTALEELQT